ncbi:MAG: hypothetical protein C5B54_07125, partial [Acidobacteria bacterium]
MRLRKFLLFSIPVVLILIALGVLNSSFFSRQVSSYLQKYFLTEYGIHLETGSLQIHWFPLQAHADNVRLLTDAGPFLTVKSIDLELLYSSFVSSEFHITKLIVTDPAVDLDHLPRIKSRQETNGTFRIDEIQIERGGAAYSQYRFANIQLQGSADSKGIQLSGLHTEWNSVALDARGNVELEPKLKYNVGFEIKGDASSVRLLLPEIGDLSGPIRTVGHVSGETTTYTVEGELQAESLSLDHSTPFQVLGKYSWNPANEVTPYQIDLTWKSIPLAILRRFKLPALTAMSNGTLKYSGSSDLWNGEGTSYVLFDGKDLTGVVTIALKDKTLIVDQGNLIKGNSRIYFSGSLNQSKMNLEVDATVTPASDLAIFYPNFRSFPGKYDVEGTISGGYDSLVASGEITARDPNFGAHSTVEYRFATNTVKADFEGGMNPAFVVPGLAGSLILKGNAQGTVNAPILTADITGKNLKFQQTTIGELVAHLKSDGNQLQAEISLPDYSADLQGAYKFSSKNYELAGQVENISIGRFAPGYEGNFRGNLTAKGNLNHWRDSAFGVTVQEATVKRNDTTLTLEQGSEVHLDHQIIEANLHGSILDGSFQLTGTVPLKSDQQINLSLTANSDFHVLQPYVPNLETSGKFRLDAKANGTFDKPALSGSIVSNSYLVAFRSKNLLFNGNNLKLQFDQEGLESEAEGSLNGATLRFNANIRRTQDGSVHAYLADFPLSSIDSNFDGNTSINLSANGKGLNLAAWNAKAEIITHAVRIQTTELQVKDKVELTLNNGQLQMEPLHLKAAGVLDLVASGSAELASHAINVNVQTNGDLSFLKQVTPDIQAGGPFSLNIRASGNWENPSLKGNLSIKQGLLRISGYPFLLENIDLEAPAEGNKIEITKATAKMGGGSVTAGGTIGLQNLDFDLWAKGENVALNYPQGLRSRLIANLKFKGDAKKALLSGQVHIANSRYRENVLAGDILVSKLLTTKKLLVPEETFSDRVTLRLDVQTDRDFLMDNNLARLRASANLQVAGTLSNPKLVGRVQAKEGSEFYWPNPNETVTLKLDRDANLDFTGDSEKDPYVEIHASTTLKNPEHDKANPDPGKESYSCTVQLSGMINNIDWTPVCNPDLGKWEFASLLTTGDTRVQTQAVGVQLATLLTAHFQQAVGQKLKLETFRIEPLLVASEIEPGARLTLGKRVTNDLNLTYSLSLSSSTDQLWIADYNRKNLSLRFIDQINGTYTSSAGQSFRFGGGAEKSNTVRAFKGSSKIEAFQITNESPLSEDEIRSVIDAKSGDTYRFWKIQDGMEQIKKKLQSRGYLFPEVRLEENQKNNQLNLALFVSGRGKRTMIFDGIEKPNTDK